MNDDAAVAALAHAIYDAESTGRLSQDAGAHDEYFGRARKLLYMIRKYQTDAARAAIAAAITQPR